MATQDGIISRLSTAKGAGQTLRWYRNNPERMYWTLKYMLLPDHLKKRQARQLYNDISREDLSCQYILRRVEFVRYVIDYKRLDLVFDIFSKDDQYLADTLKMIAKLGLTVEVEEVEVVD